ncbi:HNH endonuclease signature motif containing protein [Gordonia sp. NPDC003950]
MSVFTYDVDADLARVRSMSLTECGEQARSALMRSRREEARAVLLAGEIGRRSYEEALAGLPGLRQMMVRDRAVKAAVGDVSLALGVTRSRARQWMNLEDLLLDFPKIRAAFLEGRYSTHRVKILVQAAERAAMNAKAEPSTGGGESAGGEDSADGDGSTGDGDGVPQPDSDDTRGQAGDGAADDGDAGEADRVDGADSERDAEVDAEDRDVDVDDADPDADHTDAERPSFEDIALELGARDTADSVLRDDLDDALIADNADRATRAREEFEQDWADVIVRNDVDGHATIAACVLAQDGIYLRERMAKLIARRVCHQDPRWVGLLRTVAFGELLGAPGVRLGCQCGLDNCPAPAARRQRRHEVKAAAGRTAGRSTPSESAPSESGPSESGSSTEVVVFGEASFTVSGADEVLAPRHDDVEEYLPDDDTAPEPDDPHAHHDLQWDPDDNRNVNGNYDINDTNGDNDDPEAQTAGMDAAGASTAVVPVDTSPVPVMVVTSPIVPAPPVSGEVVPVTPAQPPAFLLVRDASGQIPDRLHGYGAIDPVQAEHVAAHARVIWVPDHARPALQRLQKVVDRAQAPPVDPTGHGGYTSPPPGALTYAPSQRIRDEVLSTDLWCRYPFCGMPAHLCELDHLVAFVGANPVEGGWTVVENLAPLCKPDHHRKHVGHWRGVMHIDRSITWTNIHTGQILITYPR